MARSDRDLDELARLVTDGEPQQLERIADLLGQVDQHPATEAAENYKVRSCPDAPFDGPERPILRAFLRWLGRTL